MSNYEYFELKYLEEIFELFIKCQEISKFNNLDILLHREDNFMDLFDLIYDSIQIDENEDLEIEDDREEYNL